MNYSNRNRDFGNGFYLTSSLEQAKSWANHRARLYNSGEPTITIYELEDKYINDLNVKEYGDANLEWLEFISDNRTSDSKIESEYDIIIGPVANDNTTPVINLYLDSFITSEEAMKRLKTFFLKDQYTIKTEKALSYLHYEGVIKDE